MIKKIFFILTLLFISFSNVSAYADGSGSGLTKPESEVISKEKRESLCQQIKGTKVQSNDDGDWEKYTVTDDGAVIIPVSVLEQIYLVVQAMNQNVSKIMVLGQALTCHASHAAKNTINIMGITLGHYPNIPIWLAGAIIYFMGFMITLSVTFYLVDVGFKLGFAIMALPVGIALWPFSWTKDKLVKIIGMILNSAAIFAFLSLTITYALRLLQAALKDTGPILEQISNNQLEAVADNFTVSSTTFLLCMFALVYGMKLIGSTVSDYADKFFGDGFLTGSSPMHGSLTQAMDFAKQKAVAPVASFAKDVAMTQTGNVLKGTVNLARGKYNNQIRKGLHYVANPNEVAEKITAKAGAAFASAYAGTAKMTNKALLGTVGRLALNKDARDALEQKLSDKLDQQKAAINSYSQKAGEELNKAMKESALGQAATDTKQGLKTLGKNASQLAQDKMQEAKDSIVNSKAGRFVGKVSSKINEIGNKISNNKVVNSINNFSSGQWRREKNEAVNSQLAQVDEATNQRIEQKIKDIDNQENLGRFSKWIKKTGVRLTENAKNIPMKTGAFLKKAYYSAVTAPAYMIMHPIKSIDNTATFVDKAVDFTVKVADAPSFYSKKLSKGISGWRDKTLQKLDNKYSTDNSNFGAFKKNTQKAAVWTAALVTKIVPVTTNIVASTVLTAPARVVGAVAKTANYIGAEVAKTPFQVTEAVVKAPKVVTKTIYKTITHPGTILKGIGDVVYKVGDKMGRNKNNNRSSNNSEDEAREEAKRKREEAEQEERWQRGAEN